MSLSTSMAGFLRRASDLFAPRFDSSQASSQQQILDQSIGSETSDTVLDRTRGVFWLLVLMFPLFILLCFLVPPFDDEFYYWCWSQELQFSYYDHPPMVAYMIRISTAIFGKSILAIRLPCVLSGMVVVGVIAWLSRPRNLVPYVVLSPVPTFAAVMITPDTPMLMFWSLYLAWLVFIHKRLTPRDQSAPPQTIRLWHWILGGIILGCGVLGKYTMGLAAIAGFFSFVAAGNWRRWIAGYSIHAAVSFLVASPILIHNVIYDFAPLRYQWEHAMSSPEPGFLSFIEFVGIQLLLFGSVPFIVFGWGLWHLKPLSANPRLRACACLFLIPFAFFLYKSTRGRLEGNWAFPCFLACWPLAAELYQHVKHRLVCRRLAVLAFALPIGTSLFLLIHSIYPIPLTPVEADRATRQWERLAIGEVSAKDLEAAGYHGPVDAPTYQWVSVLRWYGIDARQMDAASRPSHFTERKSYPIDTHQHVIFLELGEAVPKPHGYGLGKFHVFSSHQMIVRKEPGPYFHLVDCSEPPVLPIRDGKAQ